MSFRVTIKASQHAFSSREDETILEAALREGFELPYGCRNGACGSCKGRVVEGRVEPGKYDKSALSQSEIAEGMTLFCCAKPLSDLVIECREIKAAKDIQVKTLPCRVQKLSRLADTMVIYLKLPSSERLQFMAGQYIDILLKDGKRRSFSLANAPHDDEMLELHVKNVAGGSFSQHVFTNMKEKDILRFEGPLGTFCLDEASEKPIIFVASGTGFAPIKSIVEHAFHIGIERNMTLYWGVNTLSDLYMIDLPRKWAEMHENFNFVPVLSSPLPEDNWSGRTGFVHHAVMADIVDLSGHQVYACGSPVVVQAAHKDFTSQRSLPEDQFFSDAFTFSPK
jgi:CDP-4-dehydro-6-deoxyglucose reductase